jgi:opacity protein-like surface antigen
MYSERKAMKCIRILSLLVLLAPHFAASAQNLEFSGAWAHISGDNGLDGFDAGAALWPAQKVSLAFDFDSAWDTSNLGAFALTSAGIISLHSHLEDFLIGPRIHFPLHLRKGGPNCVPGEKYIARFSPFAEAQFGASHLSESLSQPATNLSESASDNAFTWMLGGGGDYHITSHWTGRVKLDYLRTHFVDSGQGRLRFSLGVAYTLGARK